VLFHPHLILFFSLNLRPIFLTRLLKMIYAKLLMDIHLFSQISSRLGQIFLLQHQRKLHQKLRLLKNSFSNLFRFPSPNLVLSDGVLTSTKLCILYTTVPVSKTCGAGVELLWSGRKLTTKVGEQPWPQLVHCASICCCVCDCIFQENRIVARSFREE